MRSTKCCLVAPARQSDGARPHEASSGPGQRSVRLGSIWVRAFSAGMAAVLCLIVFNADASAHGSSKGVARADPGRGLIYRGLVYKRSGRCKHGFVIRLRNGRKKGCTHGPDPAPRGVKASHGRSDAAVAADVAAGGTPAASGSVPCFGDGTSGSRVEAIYAVPADKPDRYAEVAPAIRQYAAGVERDFVDSAAETGGARSVRFVTSGCQLVVHREVLSARGDDTFGNTISELKARGYTRQDRKYMVWMDSNLLCGVGEVNGAWARADSACWNYAEAHELTHELGGVALDAPHSSGGYHCTDESDRMCYKDGPNVVMQQICPSWHERLMDCNHDDYFNTAPRAGSYLATHPGSNTALSPYLVADSPRPATPPAPPQRPVGKNLDGRQQAYLVGRDGHLYTAYQTQANGGWSSWVSLGGSWPSGDAIGVGTNADGRQQLYLVGNDSKLYTAYQTQVNGAWSGWISLGGTWPNNDAIGVGRNADGRQEIYLVGQDGHLYHKSQTQPNAGWSDWVSLGGTWPNSDAIGVGRNADGRQEIYLVGQDHNLYTAYQTQVNGAWSGWTSLNGTWPNSDAIGVGRNADGRQEIYLVGWDGHLYHKSQTQPNAGWSDWVSLGGTWSNSDAIGVGRNADGRQEIYLVGQDRKLYTAYQTEVNGGWLGWTSLAGSWRSADAIGVQVNLDDRQEVYLVGDDGVFYTKYQTAQNASWSASWTSLGGSWPPQ